MATLKEKRWHKANLIAWLLQMAPFIRFIGITGSMAHDIVKPYSDIDIFIITKHNRIWTCYFCVETILRFIGQLRISDKPQKRAGKICPNRYTTDQYLIINPQNKYHVQDYTQMVPLFNKENTYQKFVIANAWMEKFDYFAPKKVLNLVQSHFLELLRKFAEWILKGKFGGRVEIFFQNWQMKRLKIKYPNINKERSAIVANKNEIRIHTQPH